jgi:hypothetical protein
MKKMVELTVEQWKEVIGPLMVNFELYRDMLNSGQSVEESTEELWKNVKLIQDIQKQVGIEEVPFRFVGLWDQEEEVEIDNRDSTTTWIHVLGTLFEITSNHIEKVLLEVNTEKLSDVGIDLWSRFICLTLYKEDLEYLLKNMEENNPEE